MPQQCKWWEESLQHRWWWGLHCSSPDADATGSLDVIHREGDAKLPRAARLGPRLCVEFSIGSEASASMAKIAEVGSRLEVHLSDLFMRSASLLKSRCSRDPLSGSRCGCTCATPVLLRRMSLPDRPVTLRCHAASLPPGRSASSHPAAPERAGPSPRHKDGGVRCPLHLDPHCP